METLNAALHCSISLQTYFAGLFFVAAAPLLNMSIVVFLTGRFVRPTGAAGLFIPALEEDILGTLLLWTRPFPSGCFTPESDLTTEGLEVGSCLSVTVPGKDRSVLRPLFLIDGTSRLMSGLDCEGLKSFGAFFGGETMGASPKRSSSSSSSSS